MSESGSSTFIPGWSQKPFPGIALSAGGLLALADLQTIAQRTAITGGASWIDSLLLAPGLHYQQAADELFRRGDAAAIVNVVDERGGAAVSLKLNNAATANYIQKVAKPGETVTLNVGRVAAARGQYKLMRSDSGRRAMAWRVGGSSGFGWVSHVLYLMSPVLTLAAIAFIVLFKDWWTLMSILGLMTSRILNIWVIKQRAAHADSSEEERSRSRSRSRSATRNSTSTGSSSNEKNKSRRRRLSLSATRQHLAQYIVSLDSCTPKKTFVRLRGKASDLRAITATQWLRSKTHVEGYIEAVAKLIVYLVAALSGNMTQAGALIMMVLLLTSAGLLALSNAKAKSFAVNGRAAVEVVDGGGGGSGGDGRGKKGVDKGTSTTATGTAITGTSTEGMVERGRSGRDRPATAAVAGGGGSSSGGGGSSNHAGAGKGGRNAGGNLADLAERGQAGGHVKWVK